MPKAVFEPLTTLEEYPEVEMQARADDFYQQIKRRRTVRDYSTKPAPRDVIENCIRAAGYPAEEPTVPVITKKPHDEILSWK